MANNDPNALAPLMRGAVKAWLAAGRGAFWITSGVRSTQDQIDLRVSNGCPDIWESPASTCRIPTAIPGTSKHEIGQAVDIGGDKALAARLAPRFGLGRTVPSEDWHFEIVNPTVAATYTGEKLTMAEIKDLIDKLDEVIKVTQNQGQLTRDTIRNQSETIRKANRRQALLTRLEVLKAAKADQKDLDYIIEAIQQLGPEEAEG